MVSGEQVHHDTPPDLDLGVLADLQYLGHHQIPHTGDVAHLGQPGHLRQRNVAARYGVFCRRILECGH